MMITSVPLVPRHPRVIVSESEGAAQGHGHHRWQQEEPQEVGALSPHEVGEEKVGNEVEQRLRQLQPCKFLSVLPRWDELSIG